MDVVSTLDAIKPESFSTDADRYAAKEAAFRLLSRLQTPFERSWALSFETPVLVAGLQTCQDLGIWATWSEIDKVDEGAPQSLDSILTMSNSKLDPNLLRRLLRHMAALHILEETGVDMWKPTPFSLAMGDRVSYIDQTVQCGLDHTIPAGVNLPRFLAKHEYQEPVDKSKFDNYCDLFGNDFFAYCQKNPGAGGSFIGLMTALRNHKMDWTEVYDTNKLFQEVKAQKGVPFFVDVGGAHGLDTARILAKHPEMPADSLVVQDLPDVIALHAKEKLDSRIKQMSYDFFTPQPVEGARAYFFHAVPHDWPDADCVRIFEQVKAAMKRGFSKVLIYEIVLPPQGATSLMTTMDLQLMNCTSGFERTEDHWKKLLSSVGLKVVSISSHPRALESVIEAELA
ncbi:hypothetical protein JX265_000341 [Neoarthrinium moseri]|uniref:O-methyltransferase C-terminal domain-containing protein n=1 Tax=Neoarthrinium moseri TaxID=1658444 RepID=A0A9P9WYV3_9PEZI|nr:hypothetical protein JX265_000341 [Neoarthrinium moseri]